MNMGKTLVKIVASSAALWLFTAVVQTAQADRVYKIVRDGVIVYSDTPPPTGSGDGHEVLNNRGVVMEQVGSREERRLRRIEEREREVEAVRDRALLATFTTENDLMRTRDNRLGMIDGLIERLGDRQEILSQRLDTLENRIDMQEDANGEGNAAGGLYEDVISVKRNIENAGSMIDEKTAERTEVAEKFAADLKRYRELKPTK